MASWTYRPCIVKHYTGWERWEIRTFFGDEAGEIRTWSNHPIKLEGYTLSELQEKAHKLASDVQKYSPITIYINACVKCGAEESSLKLETIRCVKCLFKR